MSLPTDALTKRIDMLERGHDEMRQAIQRVELEQGHTRELLDARFQAVSDGQDALMAKFDALTGVIMTMAGAVDASPAGRAMTQAMNVLRENSERRLADLELKLNAHHTRFASLQQKADQLEGALLFARFSGVASLLLALGSVFVAVLHAVGVI